MNRPTVVGRLAIFDDACGWDPFSEAARDIAVSEAFRTASTSEQGD